MMQNLSYVIVDVVWASVIFNVILQVDSTSAEV